MKPVNGKNPLVLMANDIDLPMPGEERDLAAEWRRPGEPRPEAEWEDWPEDELEEDGELPEPRSEDERINGVNMPPPDPERVARRRRRLPPMPRVPVPEKADVWHPPFEVLEDGTVVGVPISKDGAPPIEELPIAILADGTREPFDPGKGSMEASIRMMGPGGSK